VSPHVASGIWGIALLISLLGWGRWIATLLGVREKAHAGLLLVWGYAAALAVGGWLCWLELAERDVLAALVGLGVSGYLLRKPGAPAIARDSAPPGQAGDRASRGARAVLHRPAGSQLRARPVRRALPGGDDRAAYFMHAKKILETGHPELSTRL